MDDDDYGPPTRHSGDAKNDFRALTQGFAWASWDFSNDRTLTFSFNPNGTISGAGYTRGLSDGACLAWATNLSPGEIRYMFRWAKGL